MAPAVLALSLHGHLVAVHLVEHRREPAPRVEGLVGWWGGVLLLEGEEVRLEGALHRGEVEGGVVEDGAEEGFDDVAEVLGLAQPTQCFLGLE